ncbi:MAG: AAA family ATPase [Pseudomonadota bacterium]
MGRSIAVMNTKGGVGKSTLVMAMAETLSAHHGRNVLVIDSDSQTSMSIMLMAMSRWEEMEQQKLTLVDYLSRAVLNDDTADWKTHVATGVSDVEEARSVYLMPSHMQLSLFERMISGEHKHAELRTLVRDFLEDAKRYFDVVLIDCPPGLSVLTETWLRESDYFMPPVKPDYLSVRGLEILKRFRSESDAHGFAELIGTIVNLKDGRIQAENDWHQHLMSDPENRCFNSVVPRRAYLQRAADFEPGMRTFIAKYPGDAGQSILNLVNEMLERIQQTELERQTAVIGGPVRTAPPVVAARAPVEPAQEAPMDLTIPLIDDTPIDPDARAALDDPQAAAPVDLAAPIGLEPLVGNDPAFADGIGAAVTELGGPVDPGYPLPPSTPDRDPRGAAPGYAAHPPGVQAAPSHGVVPRGPHDPRSPVTPAPRPHGVQSGANGVTSEAGEPYVERRTQNARPPRADADHYVPAPDPHLNAEARDLNGTRYDKS